MRVMAFVCASEVVFNVNNWHEVGANMEGNVVRPLPVFPTRVEKVDVLTGCGLVLQSWEYDVEGPQKGMHKFPLRTYNLEGEMVSDRDWPEFHSSEYSKEGNPWQYIEDAHN